MRSDIFGPLTDEHGRRVKDLFCFQPDPMNPSFVTAGETRLGSPSDANPADIGAAKGADESTQN